MTESRERELRGAVHAALERVSSDIGALDLVADIPILEAFVDDYAEARIADARSSGASWTDVAQRLGVSRQAAHKRFRVRRSGRRRAVIELRFERGDD